MYRLILVFSIMGFLSVMPIAAQSVPPPKPTPPDTQEAEQDVVRIRTNLVQIDAIVTDKNGNQVTNLTANDFELLQDGKPQQIINFSYVNTATPNQTVTASTGKNDKKTTLPPPVRVRPENAGRIITFIVDDGNCAASHSGMFAAEEGLEKFVKEQMQPNDLVAVYQTRAGTSAFQQYTSDKTQLLRVIRKVRWYPPPFDCTLLDPSRAPDESEAADQKRRELYEDSNRNHQIVGTFGVLRYVMRGLERVGGRKLVFLLSDGLPIRSQSGAVLSANDVLRDVTDLANRASVVINPIDVRGVFSTVMIEAQDEVLTRDSPNESDKIIAARTAEVHRGDEGMYALASETGGRYYTNNNFLDVPVRRALSLEKGYYLIGYRPDEETFKGKQFHKISIKVNRPELRVLSRNGFIGRTDNETRVKPRTGDSELYEAIVAPLPKAGLNLGLSAFFVNTPAEGNFVRSLLHLRGEDITFASEPDGKIKAVFDVVAVTLNEKAQVLDEFNRTHTFHVDAAALPLIKQTGLIYTTDVPVKKPGTYNFRIAVRDALSKQLGSAGQVIQVPDLKKGSLFLSGLTVSAVDANGKFVAPSAVRPENALSLTASTAVPAIRQFRPNTILAYGYTLYNAHVDKATNQPSLTVQINLYRDGQIIAEGKPQPAQIEAQADMSRIKDYGYLRLNSEVRPGDYVLQVIVKDLLAKGSDQIATQWIDFEVVE